MNTAIKAIPLLSAFALAGCNVEIPDYNAVCERTGETNFVIYDPKRPSVPLHTITDAYLINPTFIRGETDQRPHDVFRADLKEKLCKINSGVSVLTYQLR